MVRIARRRFWVEVAFAVASALSFVVTLIWHDWIEMAFRLDPDHGSGWLEWVIVAMGLGFTSAFSVSARREWNRAVRRAAAGQGAT